MAFLVLITSTQIERLTNKKTNKKITVTLRPGTKTEVKKQLRKELGEILCNTQTHVWRHRMAWMREYSQEILFTYAQVARPEELIEEEDAMVRTSHEQPTSIKNEVA
jgi:hypothetical protein